MRPVAVTAWSMVTPLGEGDETIDALFDGRSGIAPQPADFKLRNARAATLARRSKHTATASQWQRFLATRVTRRVLDEHPADLRANPDRCVFVFATSFGHLLDDGGSDTMSTWAADCVRRVGFDLNPVVVGSGCSSSADALGVAAAMLDLELVDTAIVVAVDIVTSGKRIAHSALGTMAMGEHRPFDAERNGMLLGEAAAAVILMRSEDCAERRGELIGAGASNDAHGLTAPDPSGLSVRLALDRALGDAGLRYGDLALYLAHGTATPHNDDLEARVVNEVFAGNDDLVVVGTKGALGHSLGSCGLVEFILLLQMLSRQRAPATVGLRDPIEKLAARLPDKRGRSLNGPVGVSVTLGFGGFNTALVGRA